MAGQVVSAVISKNTSRAISKVVVSAVISEITSRAISKVIGMISKQTATDDKLHKLEMLCIKINSAVEASKKHSITGTYLLKWQEKLKEAGIEGDEVLFDFRWRALTEARKDINHNIGTLGPLTYTKIAVSSIVNYFQNAAKLLLSANEDVQKLNSTVEMLEKLSADNGAFLRLVELQVLAVEEHAPAKRKKPEISEKPSADNEFLRLVEIKVLTGEEHAPAKIKKMDMSEKPSAKYEECMRSVELEILIGQEHAPAKRKTPEMSEKPSADNEEFLEHAPAKRNNSGLSQEPSADNEFLKSVELEVLMEEEHAPAKRKKLEMSEKPSADNEEFLRLVELEVLTGEEHAPAKEKKPVVICDRQLSQKETHQHLNRKRGLDCITDNTKIIGSVKRVAPVRQWQFHVAVGSVDPTVFF